MQRTKLAIAVIALAAAAAIWTATHWEGDPAQDRAYATVWKCAECGYEFDLLPAERQQALQPDGLPPILCPKCSEMSAYQVLGCPQCATLYFGPEVPGSTGFCPTCHPEKPQPSATDPGTAPKRPVAKRN